MWSFNDGMFVMYVHGHVHGRHGGQLVRRGMKAFMGLGARVYVRRRVGKHPVRGGAGGG